MLPTSLASVSVTNDEWYAWKTISASQGGNTGIMMAEREVVAPEAKPSGKARYFVT
jgi:hypothetical protein